MFSFQTTADFLQKAGPSQPRTTKSFWVVLSDLALFLVFLIIISSVAAAQPRTPLLQHNPIQGNTRLGRSAKPILTRVEAAAISLSGFDTFLGETTAS
ncbi:MULTISPECIES: hypothetical protein [unclassified Bradyrhizobium]